jgi:hypothetical protein
MIFGVGNLLNEIDDGSPKLCIWDLLECFGELEAIRGSEIVCYILHIWGVGWYTELSSLARSALRRQTPEVRAGCPNRACPDLCGGCPVMGIPDPGPVAAVGGPIFLRCDIPYSITSSGRIRNMRRS